MKYFPTIALLIILGLIFSGCAEAEEIDTSKYQLRCNQGVFSLCGYGTGNVSGKDKTIEWIIPPKFEEAYGFSDGLAAVRINGKYGFIDPTGKFVIKPKYESVGSFFKGLAPFVSDRKIGFINKQEKVVVQPRFRNALVTGENIIIGTEGQWPKGSAPRFLNSLSPTGYSGKIPSYLRIQSSADSGIYHIKKGWLTKQEFSFSSFSRGSYDLLWANRKGEEAGLMRADGSWQQSPRYVHTQRLSDGLAIVRVKNEDGTTPSGAVDENGDLVIPTEFEWLGYWVGEYGLARKGDYKTGKYGLVNRKGVLLGGRYFEKVERPNNTFNATKTVFLPRVKTDGLWHSITPEGELVEDQKKMDEIENGPFLSCDDFTITRTQSGLIAHDDSGKQIGDVEFDNRLSFRLAPQTTNSAHRCGVPISISYEGKYSFILPEGKLFADRFFEDTGAIFENVLAYSADKKWGLMDSSGQVILKPNFDKIWWYGNEKFLIADGEERYLVDKKGGRQELAEDPNYNQEFKVKLPPREDYLNCPGATVKSKNGKWGMVSHKGKVILPFKYRALLCYEDGFAWAPRDNLQKWCPINSNGEYLPEDECKPQKYPWYRWHYSPGKLADSKYESSVLWNLIYLNYGEGRASAPPILEPDGVMAHKPILMGPTHRRK